MPSQRSHPKSYVPFQNNCYRFNPKLNQRWLYIFLTRNRLNPDKAKQNQLLLQISKKSAQGTL